MAAKVAELVARIDEDVRRERPKAPERIVRERELRIRLVGGPKPHEFEVFDAETGERLLNVMGIELCVNREVPTVKVELFAGFVCDAAFDAAVKDVAIVQKQG